MSVTPENRPDPGLDQASTTELLQRLTDQSRQLISNELELARAEMTEKVKHAGIGAGLFSAAGLLGLYGLGAMIATAILALALVLDAWLAALVVTVVLFAAAGIAALVGRNQVREATPVKPEDTVESVQQDVATVKESRERAHH